MLRNALGIINQNRLVTWFRLVRVFGDRRRQSDYRAVSLAQKLVLSGALHPPRLTGAPLVRYKSTQGGNC